MPYLAYFADSAYTAYCNILRSGLPIAGRPDLRLHIYVFIYIFNDLAYKIGGVCILVILVILKWGVSILGILIILVISVILVISGHICSFFMHICYILHIKTRVSILVILVIRIILVISVISVHFYTYLLYSAYCMRYVSYSVSVIRIRTFKR